ncbi:uncharacterized protein LOC130712495 [Lotus japonicus]|uniref:uncharacterized protein LOC130712495 n=1 Tax=Lotus japonicus TaxID=34305 RepID=UPI002590FCEA|nr:uncharacterized protein LOC130712495 [Lotus japonicus]
MMNKLSSTEDSREMWIKQQRGKSPSKKDNKWEPSQRKKSFTHKGESGPSADKSHITCFECKKPEHIKPDCPKLAKKPTKKSFYKKKKALVAGWDDSDENSEDDDEESLFALMASVNSSDNDEDDELDKVDGLATAKEVWEALGLAYEGIANVRQAKVSLLVAEYETFKMKENESTDDMFGRFQTIVNGLRNLDRKYENVDQITKILRCLPRRWRPKVTAIQEAKDLSTLRLEDLLGSLKVHEIELANDEGLKKQKSIAFKANSSKAIQTKEQSENEESSEELSEDEQALFNRKFKRMWIKRQKGKGTSRKDNKRESSMKNKSFTHKGEGGSNIDKSNITCFECKKQGHIKPDCPRLAKKSIKKPFYKKKKALAAGWDDSEDGSEDDDEDALVALMASAESSDDEEDDEVKPENLKEEFNELLEHSYALSEKYKTLKNQFAKLQLEHEKVLTEKNHIVKENTALKEQDFVKEVTTLKKIIKVLIDDLSTFTIGHDNLVKLCGNSRELYDKSGLGFDNESASSSENMSDISLKSSESGQTKYVVNCKIERDERKTSYEKKVPPKNATNPPRPKKIWVPKNDRGGEFVNEEFEKFCKQEGITHQFSAPRTPQQNGVVERKNRLLQEMARTMLSETSLLKYIWAEAIETACYIQNRISMRPLLKKTPYELWRGRPTVSHFHPFGCKCFILNTKDNVGKFDNKSDQGILLGYSTHSKAYRVFNSRTKAVEESINVKFDDHSTETTDSLERDFLNLDLSDRENEEISEEVQLLTSHM